MVDVTELGGAADTALRSPSMRLAALPIAATLLLSVCGGSSTGCSTGGYSTYSTGGSSTDADAQYVAHLEATGVPTTLPNGAPPEVGHLVCKDLDAGHTNAPYELFQVSNLQRDGQPQYTLMQAEIIVYWAVTDLCPHYSSQLQPYWRDGKGPEDTPSG